MNKAKSDGSSSSKSLRDSPSNSEKSKKKGHYNVIKRVMPTIETADAELTPIKSVAACDIDFSPLPKIVQDSFRDKLDPGLQREFDELMGKLNAKLENHNKMVQDLRSEKSPRSLKERRKAASLEEGAKMKMTSKT